jgi:hypothetical protein
MSGLTPGERSLRARLAANTRWSREDPTLNAARARAGLEAKFLRQVDPDGELPAPERRRRAECARRAYYQRMAFASARARSVRKHARMATSTPDTSVASEGRAEGPSGGAA